MSAVNGIYIALRRYYSVSWIIYYYIVRLSLPELSKQRDRETLIIIIYYMPSLNVRFNK